MYWHKSKYRTDYQAAKAAVFSAKLQATTIARSTFLARANEGLVCSPVSADLSSTVEFLRLVTQRTPQSQNVMLSTSKATPVRGRTDHTPGKKKYRQTPKSERAEPTSTLTLGASSKQMEKKRG